MKLSYLESQSVGRLKGEDCEFSSLSTDTRSLKAGELFLAIKGENFDAHDLCGQAQEKGACALVVEHEVDAQLPQLLVDNSVQALGKIAALHRKEFDGKVIAITGSCGKTTVKGMLQSICEQAGSTNATAGNQNNQIGVPLTLMRLENPCDYAIVEAGTNSMGEIAYLTQLIQPDVSVVINVMPAHIGGFGSLKAIAKEKSQIYACSGGDTVAVVNLDDANYDVMRDAIGARKSIAFTVQVESNTKQSDIDGVSIVSVEQFHTDEHGKTSFVAKFEGKTVDIQLKVLGQHNIQNALAAIACASAVGISLDTIKEGLELFSGTKGRMQKLLGKAQCELIDDTYNASPGSMMAAIDYLSRQKGSILICGDMGELGSASDELHREVGEYARKKGVERLFSVGEHSAYISKGFGEGARHFITQEALIDAVTPWLNKDSTVLVKGSRSTKMELIVDKLRLPGSEL